MSTQQQQKGLLFAGDLFFSMEGEDGSFGPFVQVECDKLEIATPSEFKEKLSKGRATYGQPFVSVPVPQPAEFAITFSEVTREIFAMQLSGLLVPLSMAGGAFTDVEVTAALGAWVETGLENIAETGFTVKDSTGVTTYTLGEDYEVNFRLGLLHVLPGGAIADAATLKLGGTEDAVTGDRILGARRYKTVMRLKLDGVNLVNNQDVFLYADRAVVASDAAYDFLQDEVSEAPLTGKLEIPGPGLSPFVLDYRKTS